MPFDVALAGSEAEIGLAWIDNPSANGRSGLHFARFQHDLGKIAESELVGPCQSRVTALARSATGYVLAAEAPDGVYVLSLSMTGAQQGLPWRIASAVRPTLAARGANGTFTGGPLLSWGVSNVDGATTIERRAALLRNDGSRETSVASVFAQAVYVDLASSIFVGDGFLLAARVGTQVAVAHVGLDGTATAAPMLIDAPSRSPSLAWTGSEARLVYYPDDASAVSTPVWQRLDSAGNPLSARVMLSGAAGVARAQIVDVGQDTVAIGGKLVASSSYLTSDLELTRVSAAGDAAMPYRVAQDPNIAESALARVGDSVFVAYIAQNDSGRIGLIRLDLAAGAP
jgi:hypothetical protein